MALVPLLLSQSKISPKRMLIVFGANLRRVLVGVCWAGVVGGLLSLWLGGQLWSIPLPVQPPGLLLFPLFELVLVVGMVLYWKAGAGGEEGKEQGSGA